MSVWVKSVLVNVVSSPPASGVAASALAPAGSGLARTVSSLRKRRAEFASIVLPPEGSAVSVSPSRKRQTQAPPPTPERRAILQMLSADPSSADPLPLARKPSSQSGLKSALADPLPSDR